MRRAMRVAVGLGVSVALTVLGSQVALAHGDDAPEPTLAAIFTAWSGEILPWMGIVLATVTYLVAVRIVNRAHPRTTVPGWRVAAWLAGLATVALALVSAVDVYAGSLFSVHMVQHLLLTMVAPPLLAIGAPTTLILRVATPRIRRSQILPVLHSRVSTAISWPPVGWVVFSVVMWVTHFSPLFNAALEDDFLHSLEHLLYLAAGVLFWWPVIGADPSRWHLGAVSRVVYLAVQMPLNTAVGLAIYFAPGVLYPHYATIDRAWGPDPLTDQQVAGIVMWGAGDVILLAAVVLAIAAWLRADERRTRRAEERAVRHGERAPVESR